jgi:plasmid maintenance system killer protein
VNRRIPISLLALVLLIAASPVSAQKYLVRGLVYDSSRNYPLQSVSVLSTSGTGTVTNAEGMYEIAVNENDSIWFSYLGKPTVKFPVLKMINPLEFDVSLHVNVPTLREVRIKPKNYRYDSIQNRKDYAKVFNFQKPKLKMVTPEYGVGAGFDLDEIINMFRFKRNRSILSFQQRLLMEEQDKSIDHRFNKALVRRLTFLDGAELDSFMLLFRPSYTFTQFAGDYEFQLYIKNSFFRFKKGLPPAGEFKQEEND